MKVTRPLIAAMVAGLVASALAEWFALDREHLHAAFPYADSFLLWAAFGFFWCIVIVVVSKWLGHGLLMRHDDPYTGAPPHDPDDGASHE